MKRRDWQGPDHTQPGKTQLGLATVMSLKSLEHGNNGGMAQLMFVKHHLGYRTDNELEETQGYAAAGTEM